MQINFKHQIYLLLTYSIKYKHSHVINCIYEAIFHCV
jgi:hypothetical protein